MRWLLACLLLAFCSAIQAQQEVDSLQLEQIRRESGIDPTRIQSRIGYSILVRDFKGPAVQLTNRVGLNLGVNQWNFSLKYEVVTRSTGEPGSSFLSGFGDIKFSVLNAFWVKDAHALAGAVEFSIPTGKVGYGSQYFTATPSLTYSYTINPSTFFAIQPQFTASILKNPDYPPLQIITIRTFLARFSKSGYFLVAEPRPVIDLKRGTVELFFSPILGKSLGGGFNLIGLAEIPLVLTDPGTRTILYQIGFNKNF
jgi:hypothetical protein